MDYQAPGVGKCLVKNPINTRRFFITWNQLFADLCIVSSMLLTVTRELLLAKERSRCLTPALAARHVPWQLRRPSSHSLLLASIQAWVVVNIQANVLLRFCKEQGVITVMYKSEFCCTLEDCWVSSSGRGQNLRLM